MGKLEKMGETTTKEERSRVKIELPRGYGEVDQAGCKVEDVEGESSFEEWGGGGVGEFVACTVTRRKRRMRKKGRKRTLVGEGGEEQRCFVGCVRRRRVGRRMKWTYVRSNLTATTAKTKATPRLKRLETDTTQTPPLWKRTRARKRKSGP
jgi:hypothetical protein